jgi:hypothetical protein
MGQMTIAETKRAMAGARGVDAPQSLREAVRSARRFTVKCLSCGQEFPVDVAGSLPAGAVAIAGTCTYARNVDRYTHQPEIWWQGSRIR